ncbi:hypothetical protein [Halomarina litorea]|uniref:hypothetical protein n=1 Tax=Halomarina litorea TaxID=2961595 RepID=UPI0020C595E7|nr:hypothetical protein [Halomarina sp. BCD28]
MHAKPCRRGRTHLEVGGIHELPTDGFCFPVDTAATLDTAAVRIGQYVNVIVRDESASVVAEAPNRESVTVPAGSGPYTVEVESQPVKLYRSIDGALTTSHLNI